MTRRPFILTALFSEETRLIEAVRRANAAGVEIQEVYSPYHIPELDRFVSRRPSRIPWVCFALGALGAVLKIVFQYWTSAVDWPINVGGKPLASYPAFVPVTFEVMVLVAGLGAALAFAGRLRLYPGRRGAPPAQSVAEDSFAVQFQLSGQHPQLKPLIDLLEAQGVSRISRQIEENLP